MPDEKYDNTPTDELIRDALAADDFDCYWDTVMALHMRGSTEVFEEAKDLCASVDEDAKVLGADILGQLGTPERPFASVSTEILLDMLNDETSPIVLSAVAMAIGQLWNHDPRAVQPLVRLSAHEDADVRKSAAFGLSGYHDQTAVDAIIELSSDPDRDVRDIATHFGLDSLCGPDTPGIHEALLRRIDDEDAEIRAEALLGLAHRNDDRVIEPLINELQKQSSQEVVYDYLFEAAFDMADQRLCPALLDFKVKRGANYPYLEDALIACGCV